MVIRPTEFGMIQQQNTVSQIRHGEDARPMVEQQTMVVQSQKEANVKSEKVNHKDDASNSQKKFDARDKSDNEYHSERKEGKNKTADGKVIIKGQEYQDVDFDVKI